MKQTIHLISNSTIVAYFAVIHTPIKAFSFPLSNIDREISELGQEQLRDKASWRLREQVRQRESNWWEGVRWSIAAIGGSAFYLEVEYLKSGDCTVSWKLLQYFSTAAGPGIKSYDFFNAIFRSLTAPNAKCQWWVWVGSDIPKLHMESQFTFSFCLIFPSLPSAFLPFIHYTVYWKLSPQNTHRQSYKTVFSLRILILSKFKCSLTCKSHNKF